MLGKLIKYELKTTWKYHTFVFALWFIYVAMFSLAEPVLRNMGDTGDLLLLIMGVFSVPVIFGYMLFIMFGMPIISAIRFKRSYYSKSGYLLLTLPASVHSHIWSRIITSAIWTVTGFMFFILVFELPHLLMGSINVIDWETVLSYMELTLILCYVYLHMYTSVIVGHSFRKCRMLLSILVYFITGLLSILLLIFVGHYLMSDTILPVQAMIFGIITGIVYYTVAVNLFKRRINLV